MGRTLDINSKCINDKAGIISWMSVLPFNIIEEFVLNREDLSPPSKKNAGILKQYSGGILPEFQR